MFLPDISEEIEKVMVINKEFDDVAHLEKMHHLLSGFINKLKNKKHILEIIDKIRILISSRKNIVDKKALLRKPGFRLMITGIPFPINSGVVTVMKNIIKAFIREGANIVVINHWWHKYSFYNSKSQSYTKVRISPYSLLTGEGQLLEMKWAFKNVLRDLRDKYNYYPDLCHVHTHTFYEDKAIQILGDYFPKVPIVYTLHAFIPFIKLSKEEKLRLINDEMTAEEIHEIRRKGYKGRERAQEGMIKIADVVITISQVHKDAFDRLYPEFKNKCYCIPNGTDFELYAELDSVVEKARILRSKISPKNERIVIYVGRLEEQKGARRLLEGFNLIASKYHDAKLVIIGENDSKLKYLIDMGLDKKYLERVYLAGWVKDRAELAAYYRIADVMVQPVFSKDLYAMVTLEAMTLKVPVISCPGTLTVGTCETPESILKAADLIFNYPEAISRHLENVKEILNKEYSLQAIYEKHLKIYKSLTRKI